MQPVERLGCQGQQPQRPAETACGLEPLCHRLAGSRQRTDGRHPGQQFHRVANLGADEQRQRPGDRDAAQIKPPDNGKPGAQLASAVSSLRLEDLGSSVLSGQRPDRPLAATSEFLVEL